MSYRATIDFGDGEHDLFSIDFEISMQLNSNNRPIGIPRPSIISLSMYIHNSNNVTESIYDWCRLRQRKNGNIIYHRPDNDATLKTLHFQEAYCISYREIMAIVAPQQSIVDGIVPSPMRLNFRLSAQAISMYGGEQPQGIFSDWTELTDDSAPGSSSSSSSSSSSQSGEVTTFDAS